MMPYDFLEVYDYENSKSNCEKVCSYFDRMESSYPQKENEILLTS